MNKVLELQNHLRNRIFTVFLHRDTMYVSVVSSNYVSRKFIAILMTPTVGTTNKNKPFMYRLSGVQFHGKGTFSAVMHIPELTSTCILVMRHYFRWFWERHTNILFTLM